MTRIMVTGARGMLGKHLLPKLSDYKVSPVYSQDFDLRFESKDAIETFRPDVIFHLAANVGGLQHNLTSPASIYYDNTTINTQLIQAAAEYGVRKFIFAGSVCSYPRNTDIPTDEAWLMVGYPEENNLAYGMSKLAALIHLRACYDQFGMDFSYPVLANMYGPHDRGFFDNNRAHVVPSLIKKFMNDRNVIVWGDGRQTRDLLYVEDAAEALVKMMDIEYRFPINIATGREVSVEELCIIIETLLGFNGGVTFDESRPSGQLRRCYSVEKAKRVLDWQATISIKDGLRKTIGWYKNASHCNDQ